MFQRVSLSLSSPSFPLRPLFSRHFTFIFPSRFPLSSRPSLCICSHPLSCPFASFSSPSNFLPRFLCCNFALREPGGPRGLRGEGGGAIAEAISSTAGNKKVTERVYDSADANSREKKIHKTRCWPCKVHIYVTTPLSPSSARYLSVCYFPRSRSRSQTRTPKRRIAKYLYNPQRPNERVWHYCGKLLTSKFVSGYCNPSCRHSRPANFPLFQYSLPVEMKKISSELPQANFRRVKRRQKLENLLWNTTIITCEFTAAATRDKIWKKFWKQSRMCQERYGASFKAVRRICEPIANGNCSQRWLASQKLQISALVLRQLGTLRRNFRPWATIEQRELLDVRQSRKVKFHGGDEIGEKLKSSARTRIDVWLGLWLDGAEIVSGERKKEKVRVNELLPTIETTKGSLNFPRKHRGIELKGFCGRYE